MFFKNANFKYSGTKTAAEGKKTETKAPAAPVEDPIKITPEEALPVGEAVADVSVAPDNNMTVDAPEEHTSSKKKGRK